MFNVGYFAQVTHGRRIPTGRPLANLTSSVLHMAAADAIRQLRTRGRVNLQQWLPSFVQAATPIVSVFVREGQRQRAKELLAAIENRRRKSLSAVRKAFEPFVRRTAEFDNLTFGFDVFNPRVIEYIRTATYHFVESTLATAATDAEKAYAQVRQALGTALPGGEGTAEINRRLYRVFADPYKAARVGQTEASRAVNMGGYMAAIETNLVSKTRWKASSDACDRCLALNNQERELGVPYYVNPKGGHFAITLCPPLHPHCFCVCLDIVDDSAKINPATVDRLRTLAYNPGQSPQRFAL